MFLGPVPIPSTAAFVIPTNINWLVRFNYVQLSVNPTPIICTASSAGYE